MIVFSTRKGSTLPRTVFPDLPRLPKLNEAAVIVIGRLARNDSTIIDKYWDELFEYFVNDMPYDTANATAGDPYAFIASRLDFLTRPAQT